MLIQSISRNVCLYVLLSAFLAARSFNISDVLINIDQKVGKAGDRWHVTGGKWHFVLDFCDMASTIRTRQEGHCLSYAVFPKQEET